MEDYQEISDSIQQDRKTAEIYLLNYHAMMAEYQQKKIEYIENQRSLSKERSGGHGTMPGKPTESQALQSVGYDESQEAYTWLKAVEIYQRTASPYKLIYLDIRRKAETQSKLDRGVGRPAWVGYVQVRFAEAMAARLTPFVLSERSIRQWWDDAITAVTMMYFKLSSLRHRTKGKGH